MGLADLPHGVVHGDPFSANAAITADGRVTWYDFDFCGPGWPAAPAAPQRTLCQRVAKYLPELFEFVVDPRIPATNNAAERSLRHLVTSRKISGGTRSEEGSETKMTLATLFGAWRAEGQNPFAACREMLAAL